MNWNYLMLLAAVTVSSCDDTPKPAEQEKPLPSPLEKVGEILIGEQKDEAAEPDATAGNEETGEPDKPVLPVAEPVPDKPGFVISPYNGKWIDVTGIAPGEVMADPHFPAEEKKYFRVPEIVVPEVPEEEAAGEEGNADSE